MSTHAHRGFTLIELMIVIAIIGILSSIALPSYRAYTMQANVAAGVAAMQGVKTELAEYYTFNGRFPPSRIDYFVDPAGRAAKIERIIWQPIWQSLEVWYGDEAGSNLSGKIVMMKPDVSTASMLNWVCSNHPHSSRSVPSDALPSECDRAYVR